jgi:hypothetical protein
MPTGYAYCAVAVQLSAAEDLASNQLDPDPSPTLTLALAPTLTS